MTSLNLNEEAHPQATFCSSTRILSRATDRRPSAPEGLLIASAAWRFLLETIAALDTDCRILVSAGVTDGLADALRTAFPQASIAEGAAGEGTQRADCAVIASGEEADALLTVLPAGLIFVLGSNECSRQTECRLKDARCTIILKTGTMICARTPVPVSACLMTVWAIVPVHNRIAATRRCLAALQQQLYADRIAVLVVDDGSSDGTSEMLKQDYPAVEVIKGDGSLWWTGAVAKAIEAMRPKFRRGDFVLLLNNDVVLQPDTVSILVTKAVADRSVVWSPVAFSGSSAIACGEAGHTLYHMDRMASALLRGASRIETISNFGRCTLYPVEVLDHVKNVDAAGFPHYWGDMDFGLRAKRFGYSFAVTGETCIDVEHGEGATGKHFGFFQTPQTAAGICRYLFSRRSMHNIPDYWRYLSRHERRGRFRKMAFQVGKIIAQHRLFYWLPGKRRGQGTDR